MLSQICFLEPLILGSWSWSFSHFCVLSCLLSVLLGFPYMTDLRVFLDHDFVIFLMELEGQLCYQEEKGNSPNIPPKDVRKLSSFKNIDSCLVKFAMKA